MGMVQAAQMQDLLNNQANAGLLAAPAGAPAISAATTADSSAAGAGATATVATTDANETAATAAVMAATATAGPPPAAGEDSGQAPNV